MSLTRENDYRWVPIPIDKAFAQVQCCELHSPDIFFDIEREALAVWVGDQGVTLPSWLENDAKLTLHTQPNDRWWYVIPLRWAFASGRLPNTGTARQILGEIKDKAGTNSNSKAQREALETARNNTPVNVCKEVPPNAKATARALFQFAAELNTNNVDITDEIALEAALMEALDTPTPDRNSLAALMH